MLVYFGSCFLMLAETEFTLNSKPCAFLTYAVFQFTTFPSMLLFGRLLSNFTSFFIICLFSLLALHL